MYLPKNRYVVEYTNGGFLKNSSGQDYVGYYIRTSKNEFFQGNDLTQAVNPLTLTNEEELSGLVINFAYNDYIGPTPQDYERGFFIRYVLLDRKRKVFKEVGKKNYLELTKNEEITGIEIFWILKKPVEDSTINGYFIAGSKTLNSQTIEDLKSTYPGIETFLDPYDYLKN